MMTHSFLILYLLLSEILCLTYFIDDMLSYSDIYILFELTYIISIIVLSL